MFNEFSEKEIGYMDAIKANVTPYLSFNPIRRFSINSGISLMWRQSDKDVTYSPLATEIRTRPSLLSISKEKEIGKLLSLETNYIVSGNLSVSFDASYFISGKYVAE